MRNLNVPQMLALCVLLAVGGGFLYMRFREWRGDEEPHFLWLLAIGIGFVFGLVADLKRHAIAAIVLAAISAVACCLIGNFWIATLERSAIAFEFNQQSLQFDDFYVSLEAYLKKYENDPASPPFTDVVHRSNYSDAEWKDAEDRWNSKSTSEKNSVRDEWESDFESLNRFGDEGVSNVLLASWNWYTYSICALISAGIVLLIQRDGHLRPEPTRNVGPP